MRQIVGADHGLPLFQGFGRPAAAPGDPLPAAGVGDAGAGPGTDRGTERSASPGACRSRPGHAFSGADPEEMMAEIAPRPPMPRLDRTITFSILDNSAVNFLYYIF